MCCYCYCCIYRLRHSLHDMFLTPYISICIAQKSHNNSKIILRILIRVMKGQQSLFYCHFTAPSFPPFASNTKLVIGRRKTCQKIEKS